MLKKTAGVLGAAIILGSAYGGTASAAPETVSAATAGINAVSGRFYQDGVNIRNRPNLTATINGLGYVGHKVTVYCGTPGPLETYWWRITDNTTGVPGYIEQSFGGPNSSVPRC
ncbi:SH3 domain-containing protein [Streptomyces sp. BE20]|uniref:SH3 domain-containing protein n=1 Tax=Streptomyces sp. BE20 TaxID=3002525 RepID=UPI002E773355|nr:SH3 domain-containing protein [Streptomyces sp. BE20]MEE1821123.1 SH3 domain-containing protein [Streptomyces sp. BE20]